MPDKFDEVALNLERYLWMMRCGWWDRIENAVANGRIHIREGAD